MCDAQEGCIKKSPVCSAAVSESREREGRWFESIQPEFLSVAEINGRQRAVKNQPAGEMIVGNDDGVSVYALPRMSVRAEGRILY